MKPNVLYISLAFPPKGGPESIQAGKYYKYLKKNVGKIQVITAKCPSLFMPYDVSLETYLDNQANLIEIKITESKYINFLIRKTLPFLLELPDNKVLFTFRINSLIKKINIDPDIIYSRAFPLSSLFLGYKISRKLNKPWVIHLSDPWYLSPIDKRTKLGKIFAKRNETKFFKFANYICFTSLKTIEIYKKQYPQYSNKFILFTNVFDPVDIPTKPDLGNKANKHIIFTYTGGLANTRTAKPILEAISQLHRKKPDLFKNVIFNFAGDFDRSNKNLFKEFSFPFVKNLGILSYKNSKKINLNSNILIVIDTYFEDSRKAIFFPSKLLDYTISGKKILGITNKYSPTNGII
jgi:hypothetical protein